MTSNSNDGSNGPEVSLRVAETSVVPTIGGVSMQNSSLEASSTKAILTGSAEEYDAKLDFARLSMLPHFPLAEFPERWTQLAQYTISGTNSPLDWGSSSVVGSTPVYATLMANPAMAEKTKNWRLYRGDVEVLVMVNVPGNSCGAYAVCFYPRITDTAFVPSINAGVTDFNPEDVLAYEHSGIILVANSTSLSFTLPYWSAVDASSMAAPGATGDWVFKLVCLSPLTGAQNGAVPIGTVTLSARFTPGYEFLVPQWQGKVRSWRDTAQHLKDNKTISKTAGAVQSVATKLAGVPLLGPVAATVASVAGTVGAVADFFGFTRENDEGNRTLMATTSIQNVAVVDAKDSCPVAGFSVRNQISLKPDITCGGDADPLAFESFSQRWVAIKKFTWGGTDGAYEELATWPVTPGYGMGDEIIMAPSAAGYCGLPFEYWRATGEYLVVVPASVLNRGALQVLYVPDGTSIPGPADGPASNVGMSAVLDISASTMFQFEVGFAREAPMLPLRYWNDNAAGVIPIGTANGRVVVRVINPLAVMLALQTIECTVFARFKNVQFAVPRGQITNVLVDSGDAPYQGEWEGMVVFQGKAIGDGDEAEAFTQFTLVPDAGLYPVPEVVAGEEVRSLRALAQRPSRIFHENVANQVITFGMSGFTGAGDPMITTAAHAIAPFVMAAASERVRVIPKTDSFIGCNSVVVPSSEPQWGVAEMPASCPMTFAGPQRGAEFAVPYYFNGRGRDCRLLQQEPVSDAYLRSLQRVTALHVYPVSGLPVYEVYYSFGPDLRVGPFQRVPRFSFRTLNALFLNGWMED